MSLEEYLPKWIAASDTERRDGNTHESDAKTFKTLVPEFMFWHTGLPTECKPELRLKRQPQRRIPFVPDYKTSDIYI
jgi:hypothetical protein